MNMKKLAIVTFTIATLLVPGNGHAADKQERQSRSRRPHRNDRFR